MAKTSAGVADYLKKLPADRREAVEALRATILKNIDPAFEEGIQYKMIGYYLPHSRYPDGYHCDPKQPLPFASIASQKNHIGIYLFCLYSAPDELERFQEEWKAKGKKLDMGKSCVRFKKIEDVPLAVLGRAIKRATAKKFVKTYEAERDASGKGPSTKGKAKTTAKKVVKKKATKKAAAKKTTKKAAKKVTKKVTKKAAKKTVAKKVTKKATKKKAKKTGR